MRIMTTTLEDFVSRGWRDHADDASAVFARLPEGIGLVTKDAHLAALSALVVHVAGEHLGRWSEGIALLERLERLPVHDAAAPGAKAVQRSKAVLFRCAGNHAAEARCTALTASPDVPESSNRVRILATAASAFLGQKRLDEARADFEEAVAAADYGPGRSDPAARSLAVTGNNFACELENRASLGDGECALMLRAAAVDRRFWEIAGGWREVERAEYRLALSHVKAGDAATALRHARNCLRIVEENGSDPGEVFFAHEAIARSQLAAGDRAAAATSRESMAHALPQIVDEGFRTSCAGELAKLDAALPAR
jgi:tetratricopeptide (TPR) repeat protein